MKSFIEMSAGFKDPWRTGGKWPFTEEGKGLKYAWFIIFTQRKVGNDEMAHVFMS